VPESRSSPRAERVMPSNKTVTRHMALWVVGNLSLLASGFLYPHLPRGSVQMLLTSRKSSEGRSSRQAGLFASPNTKLSILPQGISPFEKSLSKSIDIQADFRARAKIAVDAAMASGVKKVELEFPPLLGGDQSKSQFDDFDNIQELDKNKDWTMQFAPMFHKQTEFKHGKTWLIFPDLKECEIAKKEWAGQRYQEQTFTTIEAATNFNLGEGSYDAPWGSALISGISKIMGGAKGDAGLLGNQESLDSLDATAQPTLNLVIQPGNGGPVEDWINCERIYDGFSEEVPMVVINGALDKLRGGYYPRVVFPKLAASVDSFFSEFESVFYLKPISDKGVYGWLFRMYPEPWQVILQRPVPTKSGNAMTVEDTVVYFSEERPSYNEAVSKLVQASQSARSQ
jgi:hypothetical protein